MKGPLPAVLPEAFLRRLAQILPEKHYQSVLKSFDMKRALFFRFQKPGVDRAKLVSELKEAGLDFCPVAGLDYAFELTGDDIRALQDTSAWKRGDIYVQGLSSMFAARALDPKPGETILDMAAAPGSKTTQIAFLMRGEGKLTANDANRGRFFKLKSIVEAQGLPNVSLSQKRGETLGYKYAGTFDRVLLDAPCSSEGRFSNLDPASVGYWKPGKIKQMAGIQKKLLLSAFSVLKPGGVLLYSTCTFAPEENEAVVSWALEKFGKSAAVESVKIPQVVYMKGLVKWKRNEYPLEIEKTLRILPDRRQEAFYLCRLRKIAPWTVSIPSRRF